MMITVGVEGDICYLDHAGAGLYSEKQLQLVFNDVCNNIYANPHSLHLSSKLTEDNIDIIRFRILQHFNTTDEEYTLIFTSGATQSLKIVGESFNYGLEGKGCFTYLENNHTSVLGMRSYAKSIREIKTEDAFRIFAQSTTNSKVECTEFNNLFIYPAECNFSGTKYPLEWIEKIQKGALNPSVDFKSRNWYVLLDAPCFLSTSTLDLSQYKPDFVTISFYKIFGYPTGLGGLLVRKSSEKVLHKKYYGGGTVEMVLSEQNVSVPRKKLSERFEDGTLPFLSILALKYGFDTIKRLNLSFDLISEHTFSLAQYVYKRLLTLHHSNGAPVAILYHDTTFVTSQHQGPIVNFNLVRCNGEHVGYSEVLHMANLHGIHLRTGCHCNPGGCQRFLNLEAADVIRNFKAGHVCGDQRDLIDGYPTGTVRISFGYMSTKRDADQFLKLIEDCFVTQPIVQKIPSSYKYLKETYLNLFYSKDSNSNESEIPGKVLPKTSDKQIKQMPHSTDNAKATLDQIILYPVKSCGAFVVKTNWIVTKKGFKFDREWMIVNSSDVCLTQKQNKKMCLIRPSINLKKNTLNLNYNDKSSIEIDIDEAKNKEQTYLCQSKVCGDRVVGWDCGDDVSDWLSENLGVSGLRLLRQYEPKEEGSRHQLSFANQAQYLLTNSKSVEWLRNQVPEGELTENLDATILRFRPNIVVSLSKPFEENEVEEIVINKVPFKFAGKCTRCQMICIDQCTGGISKEPLLTLSKTFKGKINFGIYLNKDDVNDDESNISVGNEVFIKKA
ncbi:molybdenum cofactor sulfurase 3 isoform X2 [Diabrotica virgifera virgifera]|uniref:Molybdenum cofactor sulfurase n=1 Tax=Diabrotica virgifera virgifera TaxID=50390 RepID=A0ABM5K350_DIAVI|nr:molybdenum cofactor sulfurase 3 isoform X2 [Diabrotica virgifera virgifera]